MNTDGRQFINQGLLSYQEGDFAAAVGSLSQGLKLMPNDWQNRFVLAMAYGRAGMMRESRQEFMTIRDICPDADLRRKAATAVTALAQDVIKPAPPKRKS